MIYTEDDLLPLSALQHLLYCPRQCGLIHVERIWMENRFTAEGRIMHERVHTPDVEQRRGVRVEYALAIRSLRLGLAGVADVVEFHPPRPDSGRVGEVPYPIEYKRGKPKPEDWDRVQLCAQAMCLEEMLDVSVPEGALFYGKERRRNKVEFTADLRQRTEDTARRLHELVAAGITPSPEYGKKCDSCSLREACLPKPCAQKARVSRYLNAALEET